MENEVNQRLEEIYTSLENTLPRKRAQVTRAVDRTRLIVADILAKHTGSDGKVPINRIGAVTKDLARLEPQIYRAMRQELEAVIRDGAEFTTVGIAEAVALHIGADVVISTLNLPAALAELSAGVAEAIFSALTSGPYSRFVDSTVSSTFNRKGEDELILIDRLRRLAADMQREVEDKVRRSIRNGENASDTLRSIDRSYSDNSWRLDTLVETEVLFAMRQAVAKFAEESGLVQALKITDFPHGDPKVHARHKCYQYARADEHGMGPGVYPIGTRKIRNPHPRCRSALFFVLIDDLQ